MGTGERNDEWGLYRGMKSGSAGPGNRRGSDKLMDGEKQTEASLKVPGGLMGVENAGGWVWVFLKKQNICVNRRVVFIFDASGSTEGVYGHSFGW